MTNAQENIMGYIAKQSEVTEVKYIKWNYKLQKVEQNSYDVKYTSCY